MKTPEHIIVVDDDKEIRSLLSEFLSKHNYQVTAAQNGDELTKILHQQHDIALIILDIMLPGIDGLEICKKIRASSNTPILMLTAVSDMLDRIIGLEVGADDYLTKPFNPRELLARIRAILRRTEDKIIFGVSNQEVKKMTRLKFSGWVLDTAIRRLISPEEIEIPLNGRGYDLLLTFLEHPQRVLSRDHLLDILSNRSAEPFDRSIDVQVSRLRLKLGDDPKDPKLIKTIRTGGYMFASAVDRA